MDDLYAFSAQVLGYALPAVNEAVPLTFTLAATGLAGASVTVPLMGLAAHLIQWFLQRSGQR